jgi:hypothetical protein
MCMFLEHGVHDCYVNMYAWVEFYLSFKYA